MRLRDLFEGAARTALLMVGLPDYDAYVAHRQAEHPDEPFMTYVEFVRNRTEQRFDSKSGNISRCC